MNKAWRVTVVGVGINQASCDSAAFEVKDDKDDGPVDMGGPTTFRKVSMRKHLQGRAARDAKDHVFWEVLYCGGQSMVWYRGVEGRHVLAPDVMVTVDQIVQEQGPHCC